VKASNWDKAKARRLGMSLEEYMARKAGGEHHCSACDTWHPEDAFGRDASRPDGRARRCKVTEAARTRERAQRKPEPPTTTDPTTTTIPTDPRRLDVLHTVYSMLRGKRPHGEIEDVIREAVGR